MYSASLCSATADIFFAGHIFCPFLAPAPPQKQHVSLPPFSISSKDRLEKILEISNYYVELRTAYTALQRECVSSPMHVEHGPMQGPLPPVAAGVHSKKERFAIRRQECKLWQWQQDGVAPECEYMSLRPLRPPFLQRGRRRDLRGQRPRRRKIPPFAA